MGSLRLPVAIQVDPHTGIPTIGYVDRFGAGGADNLVCPNPALSGWGPAGIADPDPLWPLRAKAPSPPGTTVPCSVGALP